MLKSIDILIGLSVVMLVASMAVTVMTGFINHIRNNQGRQLQKGIADLLLLINPKFDDAVVQQISRTVLMHPLIREGDSRLGTCIHREELTKLLMELATGNEPKALDDHVQAQLTATLANHGVTNPAETLKNVRMMALRLEKLNPELSEQARANLAILTHAETDFVAKINTWFDQTMDRVSARFTLSTRVVTLLCGLLLALVLQLDTVALVNRISVDDALRASLVRQAENIPANAVSDPARLHDSNQALVAQGVISMPRYPEDLRMLWDLRHLTGILFTTLLLSLGAPFWYGALKQLLQLRSKIAQTDDTQRKERQSTQILAVNAAIPPAVVIDPRAANTNT